MLTWTFFRIVTGSPKGRRFVFRQMFEFTARRYDHITDWTQMNYGYAEGPGDGHTIALKPEEEHERYCHQLYYRAVQGMNLPGKDVVEVSCGRGGGAAFIHRHLQPRTMTAIDIAAAAIKFCRRVHRAPELRFVQGEAEELPLFDESADVLINVEASFCYEDLDQFFREAHRVLRPGGYFCYTDLQAPEDMDGLTARLERVGFDLVRCDDITANVTRALELDARRRSDILRAHVPWYLRHAMRDFAGIPGSRIPTKLVNGTFCYCSFTLRKRAQAEELAVREAA